MHLKLARPRSMASPSPSEPARLATPVRSGGGAHAAWLALQRSHGNRYVQRAMEQPGALRSAPSASGWGETPPLSVGAASGPLEREADRAADAIVGGGRPRVRDAGGSFGVRALVTGEIETNVRSALAEGGEPLPAAVRAELEPRFEHDLSHVRLHSSPAAARAANALEARAFTLGGHVVFGASQYRPETLTGRRLLGHELAHTLQQKSGSVGGRVLQRTPLGSTAEMHEEIEEDFTREHGRPPVGGAHGREYAAWLEARHPRETTIDRHAREQARVYDVIEAGLRFTADPSKGTSDNATLFHNSCQIIAARRFRTIVLTRTHDADTRRPGVISYFDPTIAWPARGGEYPASSSVTTDRHLFTAPPNTLGGYSQGQLKLIGTERMSDESLRSTIVHEVQHAIDRTDRPSRDVTDPIAPIYRVSGTPPPGGRVSARSLGSDTHYNLYQTEFRAYWVQAEQGSTGDRFGSTTQRATNTLTLPGPTAAQPTVTTHFANERQENIFWHLVNAGYDFVADEYTHDPAFKDMVDNFSVPRGGNLVNSVRILELGDAIEACEPQLRESDPRVRAVLDRANALDEVDRAFLRGSLSGPFWDHARSKLRRSVLAILTREFGPASSPLGDFPPDPSMRPRKTGVG